MKILLFIILCSYSIFGFTQVELKKNYIKEPPGQYHELIIDDLFKSEFDSVFPGVKIIKRIGLDQGYSPISFVLNNDTISYLMGCPKVLLDCALLDDSIFRYTEETAIKAYIYLNHMQNQQYPFSEINYIKILKKDTSFLDNNKYHKEQDSLYINYIIDIKVDAALNRDRNLNSSLKLRYYLNAEKGIVKYYCIETIPDNKHVLVDKGDKYYFINVISDDTKYRSNKHLVSQSRINWKIIEEDYNWQRKKKIKIH